MRLWTLLVRLAANVSGALLRYCITCGEPDEQVSVLRACGTDLCIDNCDSIVVRAAEQKTKHKVTPVFVSIDPERDSVQQVKEYVQGARPGTLLLSRPPPLLEERATCIRLTSLPTTAYPEFHPRLVGLTGSVEACTAAAKAFRVYYHKTGEDQDYLVDHSIISYLLGAQTIWRSALATPRRSGVWAGEQH